MRTDHVSEGPRVAARRAVPPAAAAPVPTVAAAWKLPCRSNPELFFAEDPKDVQRAKALCSRCPVRHGCLAGALQRGEPWGVWGGELFLRGVVIAEKRPRGRPRKAGLAGRTSPRGSSSPHW
jgi:WhiB family transcriptional regulator, redox-sensing transcriptional regulator